MNDRSEAAWEAREAHGWTVATLLDVVLEYVDGLPGDAPDFAAYLLERGGAEDEGA